MPDINVTIETTPPPTLNVYSALLPTQSGHAGKVLATNGSSLSWTNEPTFQSAKIQDASFPLFELRCTTAPTDKKFVRWTHDASGLVKMARVNDAYTLESPLIYWDASNNTTLGGGAFTVNGSIKNVSGTIQGISDSLGWYASGGASAAGTSNSGAWIGLHGGTEPTSPGILVFGRNSGLTGIVTEYGWGIGTTNVQTPLTVGGDIWINTVGSFYFSDANGTSPVFKSQSDNNFVFYGTSSTGNERPIWSCFMRSDTEPLRISVPLKLGQDGTEIKSLLSTVLNAFAPAAIPANGGVQFTDVALTGATAGSSCSVNCIGGNISPMNNNSIALRAECRIADTVRVFWINPTAAPVTLTATAYRVTCMKF